jgi:hypothetical protein
LDDSRDAGFFAQPAKLELKLMTTVEIVFFYTGRPGEGVMRALNAVREVYGIRRILFDEAASTVRVEYDATRLNGTQVRGLLRRAGINAFAAPLSA